VKRRLYYLVTERGFSKNEAEARAKIMAGEVLVDGEPVTKAAWLTNDDSVISLKPKLRYVSRGGAKMASVAAALRLSFKDKVVVDVGASTGGFTDFALQHGARRVYAIDAGTAQLDFRLRQDPRVVVMEKTDIRDVEALPEAIGMAVVDISFMSVTRILQHLSELIAGAPMVVMVKPQFEAPKAATNRTKGVVKEESMRRGILQNFERAVEEDFEILAKADSKVAGMKGNVERFYVLKPKYPGSG
jgi:23S rRNA (cytidine1920-2'-O)/16S rRNA (cytidine1409-2'-O)-methyltransferase